MTSNEDTWDLITRAKLSGPSAVFMRLFAISLNDYKPIEHDTHRELAAHLGSNVYGVWTQDYVKFVNNNRDAVVDKLNSTIASLRAFCTTEERFYMYQIASTLVGGWIGRQIGAFRFSVTNLNQWARSHVKKLRVHLAERSVSIEEQFAQMLADLHGSVLITKHYDLLDLRSGKTEVPMFPMRSEPKARLVLGSDLERPKLFVSVRAVDEWCAKNKISSIDFKRSLSVNKYLRVGGDQGKGFDKKVRLGKGVPATALGQCRCLELDHSLAQGYAKDFVKGSKVVPIGAKSGDNEPQETDAEAATA